MDKKEINLKTYTELLIEYLEATIADEMILNSFIRDLEILKISETEVFIYLSSLDAKKIINTHYKEIFNQAVSQIFEKNLTAVFELDKKIANAHHKKSTFPKKKIKKFEFNNYVLGEFNKEAVQIAKEIIKKTGIFSPFYVCSKSGLGKTHLLHAIENSYKSMGKKSIYIEPNLFTRRVVECSKAGSHVLQQFIDEINSFDVLLFDDIQNLGDREVTLKVLFNIINNALENDKQIVITSDKVAQELSGFENRFITRFSSGISSLIKEPKLNDLVKILQFKLKKMGFNIENWRKDALEFVAKNNSSSIRSIEGAIKRISFFTQDKENTLFDLSYVSNIFKDFSINFEELTPERIVKAVANYYEINPNDIKSKSRKRELMVARNMTIWLIRKMINISYKEIGRIIGGRDHSTILSSINRIKQMMKLNSIVKFAAEKIERKIKNEF